MTPAWLSDGWCATAAQQFADASGPPTLTGTVVLEVTGVPDGEAAFHATFAEGRLVASGTGSSTAAEATLTLTDDDARAVATGALDPSVAFMQGRMKVTGSMAVVLDLLAAAGTDASRALLAEVAARTEF